jgi:hypothetical protein
MSLRNRYLLNHRRNRFSQSGEDGVLEYVLSRLPVRDFWCVEFGAWDGKHLSNTFHLVSQLGHKAVLIEADPSRFDDLSRSMKAFPNVVCMRRYVESAGAHSLDAILRETTVPKCFDLLSSDIDGDDYYVWEGLSEYSPKVVIIELNNLNKPGTANVPVRGEPSAWGIGGTSISSMTDLAHRKGYSLIAHVGCNAIFVKREFLHLFHSEELGPSDLFTYEGFPYSDLSLAEALTKVFERFRYKVVNWLGKRL